MPLKNCVVNGHYDDSIAKTRLSHPLTYAGHLDTYQHSELTPGIGREYTDLSIQDLLGGPNKDNKIRDLAVTISQRGVVILRGQHNLKPTEMRDLIEQLSFQA